MNLASLVILFMLGFVAGRFMVYPILRDSKYWVLRQIYEHAEILTMLIILLFGLWLVNRPCIIRPAEPRDCYCEGYKDATGNYPPPIQNQFHDHVE